MFGVYKLKLPAGPKPGVCQRPFDASVTSGAEEHEPDHTEDQHSEAGGDKEESKYRWPRLGLPRFGWRFDDLALLSCCHDDLDSFDVAPSPSAQDVKSNA
jgi:hypothetical protein